MRLVSAPRKLCAVPNCEKRSFSPITKAHPTSPLPVHPIATAMCKAPGGVQQRAVVAMCLYAATNESQRNGPIGRRVVGILVCAAVCHNTKDRKSIDDYGIFPMPCHTLYMVIPQSLRAVT